ncbi:MAG: hypothetical protein LBT36_05060, partial [Oscillospiraceae bacterium]|nr:hypothetical protein [Oscillospiraceae bacterium]
MSARGGVYLALMGMCALRLLYSAEGLYLWLLLVLALAGLVGLIGLFGALASLRFDVSAVSEASSAPNTAESGGGASLTIRFRAASPLALAYGALEYVTPEHILSGTTARLPFAVTPSPFGTRAAFVAEPFRCAYRGEYDVGPVAMTLCDVFGLFFVHTKRVARSRVRLTVLPRAVLLAVGADAPDNGAGDTASVGRAGDELSVSDLRAW